MLRGVLLLGALGIGTGFVVGAEPKPTNDLSAIQGNWKPLQIEYQGKMQMPVETMNQVTGVYENAEYFLYFKDKTQGVLLLAHTNIALDPKKNPKEITFEFVEGSLKGIKRHGIYEIAGNELKLCYGPIELPRPTEFKSTPSNGYYLETWARQQK